MAITVTEKYNSTVMGITVTENGYMLFLVLN